MDFNIFFFTKKKEKVIFVWKVRKCMFSKLFAMYVVYKTDKILTWKLNEWIECIKNMHRWNAKTSVIIMVLK